MEHPFGTIKRTLGYTCFLQRGHENIKCESYMHFFVYNLKRVINIMGIAQLLDVLKEKIAKSELGISSTFSSIFATLGILRENAMIFS